MAEENWDLEELDKQSKVEKEEIPVKDDNGDDGSRGLKLDSTNESGSELINESSSDPLPAAAEILETSELADTNNDEVQDDFLDMPTAALAVAAAFVVRHSARISIEKAVSAADAACRAGKLARECAGLADVAGSLEFSIEVLESATSVAESASRAAVASELALKEAKNAAEFAIIAKTSAETAKNEEENTGECTVPVESVLEAIRLTTVASYYAGCWEEIAQEAAEHAQDMTDYIYEDCFEDDN